MVIIKKRNDFELEKIKHKYKMIETQKNIDGLKEVEKMRHLNELELQRIKAADIRRSAERRSNVDFMRSYK